MNRALTAAAAPDRRRLPRGEREERMLDAGERIFGRRGFRSASMEEIADASGITKALLYQYFGSKEGLYEACVERARARLFDRLEYEAESASPGRDRLRAVIAAYFEFLDEQRSSWWLLYGDASMNAVNDMRRRNAEVIASLIARDVEGADGHLDEEAVELLGHLIVGSGEQVARWWLERPGIPKEQAIERFLAATEAAIGSVLRA
ncbi:MAG: TetR/AcrR family transcriptional regulator [Actinobacteria bacterium]|nr:MAG: TetR/AcrR family transcriptional regulator [Actinomycetota bacterium]